MFRPTNHFAQAPCPHRSHCLLPLCIYSHDDLSPQTSLNGPELSPSNRTSNEPPLKRQRRDDDPPHSVVNPLPLQNLKDGAQRPDLPATLFPATTLVAPRQDGQRALASTTKPISPPPTRRAEKLAAGSQSLGKNSRASVLSSGLSRPEATQKSTAKKEGLNPRMLPQPPTSHGTRVLLLKALYDQHGRLNRLSSTSSEFSNGEEKPPLDEQDIINIALDEEEKFAREKRLVYSNVVKNRIMALKKMKMEEWQLERFQAKAARVAAESGNERSLAETNLPPKPIVTGLGSRDEILMLNRLKASPVTLQKYGFILTQPTEHDIADAKAGLEAAKGYEICDRCKARFQVFPGRRDDGLLTTGGKCVHHWGRAVAPQRKKTANITGHVDKTWSCCGLVFGASGGCTTADTHVFKISDAKRLAAVLQYQSTPVNTNPVSHQAVCFDCEMGYTVYGLELLRLTATSWPSGEPILDVLVRPIGEILDLNSRFSGVFPAHMASAKPCDPANGIPDPTKYSGDDGNTSSGLPIVASPVAARSLLFSLLTPETPLIGHALENDLNASRVIHPVLVDTAILSPHRAGPPYRNGLKMLMQRILDRRIQVDNQGRGHDSKEDANAAGDLVKWKVGKEWQKLSREGWRLDGGALLPPLPFENAPVAPALGPQGRRKRRLSDQFEGPGDESTLGGNDDDDDGIRL